MITLAHLHGSQLLHKRVYIFAGLLLIIAFAGPRSNALANPRPQKAPDNALARAQTAYTQGEFDEAIKYYRIHLRSFRMDFNSWNLLGTAYYHAGQPDRAIEYLRYAAPRTTQRSHNFYYQGLSYLAIKKPRLAKQLLQSAANFTDEHAEKAAFELATIEFNARQKSAAAYWVDFYQKRFPRGPRSKEVGEMSEQIRNGKMTANFAGNDKVDLAAALYKNHAWSLSDRPNYWLAQIGYEYANGSEKNPAPSGSGGLVTSPSESQALLASAGFGLGPMKRDMFTTWVGYHYKQRWETDSDRLQDYLDDPTDISYLPYRADVLERRHQFKSEIAANINPALTVGAFGQLEFARVGSSYFPSPEDKDLRKVFKVSDTTLFVPWLQYSYVSRYRTDAHLFLRKELNDDMPEASHKTFNIFDDGDKALSLGINQNIAVPEYKLSFDIGLYRYEYIYNDAWFDFTRTGYSLAAAYEFYRNFSLQGMISMHTDAFTVPRLKQNSCSYLPTGTQNTDDESTAPLSCARKDTGLIYQAGIYWNHSQFYQLSGVLTMTENANAQQQIFDRTKLQFLLLASMSFPDVRAAIGRHDRFESVLDDKEID